MTIDLSKARDALLGKICIFTGDRGLTVIGRFVAAGQDPDLGLPVYVFAAGCAVVRRWGTDAGIGQLVHGKRAETILDRIDAPTFLPAISSVSLFPVNQDNWAEHFPDVDYENGAKSA